jgi:hypothetical protein
MKTKDQKTQKSKGHSKEIQKKPKPSQKRSDAIDEFQQEQHQSSTDGSYSAQHDITPPNPHEPPSFGIAETDFLPGNHGRRTGRMIDHEPGL